MKSKEYSFNINEKDRIEFRLLTADDSITEITQLLNKSYKLLSDMGLDYVAATQNDHVTLKRIGKAYKSFVGICKGQIIATISIYKHKPSKDGNWYNENFVAKIGQFAVLPEYQKYGIGSNIMDIVEVEAKDIEGIKELALDTAETADHLISFYKKRGYQYIETTKWHMTNYKSVILSKRI